MNVLDFDPSVMLNAYVKEIRYIVELSVPAWQSGLKVKQSADLERVQRVAVHIILSDSKLGKSSSSYDNALYELDLENLWSRRRKKLCFTFAKKTLKSRHKDMFVVQHQHDTRNKTRFYENNAKNGRYQNYLTRLLNAENKYNSATYCCNYWTMDSRMCSLY